MLIYNAADLEALMAAVFDVTGGELPSLSKLSELRGEHSFWRSIAIKLNPGLRWEKKLQEFSLKYYKKCKYMDRTENTFNKFLRELQLYAPTWNQQQLTYENLSRDEHASVNTDFDNEDFDSQNQESSPLKSEVKVLPSPYKLHKVIRGSYHQGNIPGEINDRSGKQCSAISAVAIVAQTLSHPESWTTATMNSILNAGDKFYDKVAVQVGQFRYLDVWELENIPIQWNGDEFTLKIQECGIEVLSGHVRKKDPYNLQDILPLFFEKHDSGFLTAGGYTYAIWKNERTFWLHDSHARDENGKIDGNGVSFCGSFDLVKDLSDCISQNFENDAEVFMVVGVQVCKSALKVTEKKTEETPKLLAKISTPVKPFEVKSTPKRSIRNLFLAVETEMTKELKIQLQFSFTLPPTFWTECFSNGKFNPNNSNDKWTNILAELFREGNNVCSLKVTNTYKPDKPKGLRIMTITAQCMMKGCFVFKLYVNKNKENENRTLEVDVKTFGNFTHQGDKHRRHCTGTERENLRTLTEHIKPNELKIKKIYDKKIQARLALDHGNYDHTLSRAAMQKISSEQNLAGDKDKDVWKDLVLRKEDLEKEFNSKIFRELCQYPFKVIWMSDDQIRTYLQLKRPRTLHIDATGSEIAKLPWAESDIHHYAAVVNGGKNKAPVCLTEFLTEVKNTTKISSWLKTWQDDTSALNNGTFPNPDIVVIDYSWALIHSTLDAFYGSGIIQYLNSVQQCKEVHKKINHVVLTLCVAHVIHAVARHLSQSINIATVDGRKVRRLALHIFAAMQRTDDIEQAKVLFANLALIFDTEYLHRSVAKALVEMADLLASDNQSEFIDEIVKKVDEEEGEKEDIQLEDKTLWEQSPFTKTFLSALSIHYTNGTKEQIEKNIYYVPGFAEHLLKRYMPYYPLWSCYILRLTGYTDINPPSNWPVESYFNASKNHILNGKLHQRPGRFFKISVPKVQQRLADFEYDVDFKKYRVQPKAPKPEEEDVRNAVDRWSKGKKSRGKAKGKGAYSILTAKAKFKVGSGSRSLIDKLKAKYKITPKKRIKKLWLKMAGENPFINPDSPTDSTDNINVSVEYAGEDPFDNPDSPDSIDNINESQIIDYSEKKLRKVAGKDPFVNLNSPDTKDNINIYQIKGNVGMIQESNSLNVNDHLNHRKRSVPEVETELLKKKKSKPEDVKRVLFATPNKECVNLEVSNSPWHTVTDWPKNLDSYVKYTESEELAVPSLPGFYDLKKLHMVCLFPSRWLSDVIVERFLNIQCSVAKKHFANIYNMSSEFMMNIHSTKPLDGPLKFTKSHDILSKDILLAPHCYNNHWSLYVMSFKHQTVVHIDSLGLSPDEKVIPYIKKMISSLYMEKHKTNFNWSKWSYYSCPDVPNQGNGCDCGVHVCVWAHAICSGEVLKILPEESTQMRQWIMQVILQNTPEKFKKTKVTHVSHPTLNKRTDNIIWAKEIPKGFSSSMHFCAKLVKTLFESKDGVCAMKRNCIAKGEEEVFCWGHQDYFHLECVNDTPSANSKHNYNCPMCRSSNHKKKNSQK